MKPIKTYSIDGIYSLIDEVGIPAFRALQLLEWLYEKGACTYEEMTNLPKSMRLQLAESFPLYGPSVAEKLVSKDGSRKYLLKFHDNVMVETVGIPSDDDRLTVCCSSQAGCAMECLFCATGKQGIVRDLCVGEIVDQVLAVQRDFGKRVSNVVIMGQGEPFANYDAVIGALQILNHPKLLNIGARHITVSTCGIISGIERLGQEKEQFTLAVSLHSARQDIRNTIMPAMKNQPLDELRNALFKYTASTGRRFSFEYILLDGINDSNEDLQALIEYCNGMLCHVNLIPFNEIQDSPVKPSDKETLALWQSSLENAGIATSIRKSKGSDIAGACGQLANRKR